MTSKSKFSCAHERVGGEADVTRGLAYSTVVSRLRQYADDRALSKGRSLHGHIVDKGLDQETFLGNLLVQMYGKCGSVDEARRAFDRILEPNVYSWTIMVTTYAENGELQNARDMFELMPEKNVVSWTSMLSTYAQHGYLQEARTLFDRMPVRTVVSWNALIAGFGQNGLCEEAVRVYKDMLQEGVKPNESSFVSTVDACATGAMRKAGQLVHANAKETGDHTLVKVGNALINFYGSCGCWEDAKQVFDEMPQRNVIAWTALLVAYAKSGKLQDAETTFDTMPLRSVVSWSAMIAAYAQTGQDREALQLFRRMDIEGQKPDGVTFISTLYVCGSLSALEVGQAIYEDIVGTRLESDVTVSTALLDMFSRCGSLDHAKALFDKMVVRDVIMWTSMLSAYAKNGEWLQVLHTYYYMLLDGVKPNRITLMSVLSACSHAGLVRESWELFTSMDEEYNMTAEYRHYVCMVDALARAGQVRDAEELIQEMPFEPDGLSWRTLLSACKTGNAQQGARAAENVFELEPDHGAPYVLLSNIHSESSCGAGLERADAHDLRSHFGD